MWPIPKWPEPGIVFESLATRCFPHTMMVDWDLEVKHVLFDPSGKAKKPRPSDTLNIYVFFLTLLSSVFTCNKVWYKWLESWESFQRSVREHLKVIEIINVQSMEDRKTQRRSQEKDLFIYSAFIKCLLFFKISLSKWQTKITQTWPWIIRCSHYEEKYRDMQTKDHSQ
jgi:hypothetical protein